MKALLHFIFLVCVITLIVPFVFAAERELSWLPLLILSNEKPEMVDWVSSVSVAENRTASVARVRATDPDGDRLTYSLTGTDASSLWINSKGVIRFNTAPDYETKSSYSVNVVVSDGSDSTTETLTINVTNKNDNDPIITSSASFSVNNGDTSVGTVAATDADGDTVSYSLSGTDSSLVAINSSTGAVTLNSAADHGTKSSYSVTVTATDGENSATQAITITVTEPPTATAASYYWELRPQTTNSYSIQLSGTVPSGRTASYAIVTNGTYGTASVDSSTGFLIYSTTSSDIVTEEIVFKVNDGFVDSDNATITIEHRSDPLYKHQWHLDNTGQTNFADNGGDSGVDLNLDTVISSQINGTGVVVAVVDSGLEIAHEDLSGNVLSGKSWDYVGADLDPTTTATDGDHGTSVAGIIAAEGWNNLGGRGVAPGANLVGYNYLSTSGPANHANALGDGNPLAVSADVDVFNLSYGRNLSQGATFPTTISSTVEGALENGVTNYRSGKGAIYVNSAGNDWKQGANYCGQNYGPGFYSELMPCWDSSFDELFATPYIIGVGSLAADNVRAVYSTPGASVWVSGFGGQYGHDNSHAGLSGWGNDDNEPAIMTVDQGSCSKGYVRSGLTAGNGYNYNLFEDQGNHAENASCNYTSTFSGTSSAAPTISGVVALMLEANPDLTWRDVKHILASTSVVIDGSRSKDILGVTQYEWVTNAAGYNFHTWYGFGKVDAAAAVSSAQSYTAESLGTFVVSDLELSAQETLASYTINTSALSVTKPGSSEGIVEFVRLGISLDHAVPYDVGLRLTSPDGTTANVMFPFTAIATNPVGVYFELGVNAFYGESMEGTWTISIDEYTNDSVAGEFIWDIRVYGR